MNRHFSWPWLAAILLCFPLPAAGQERSPKEQLDKLLEAYKAYGLPLPPDDAPLVRCHYQSSQLDENGQLPPARIRLAFRLKPQNRKDGAELLVGAWKSSASDYKKVEIVEPRIELLDSVNDFGDSLFFALQCQDRGWHTFAEESLARGRQLLNRSTEIQLASRAWQYWMTDLTEAETDWAELVPQLKVILDRQPTVFTAADRELWRSMALSLKPSNAKPWSIHSFLDEFLKADSKSAPWLDDSKNVVGSYRVSLQQDERYLKIIEQGFAAIPELIASLDDRRLTRTMNRESNTRFGHGIVRPDYPYRVATIAGMALQELSSFRLQRGARMSCSVAM